MAIGQIPRKARLASLLNFKVRVTMTNSSQFIGTLLSFDKYMNVVLGECEEFRLTKKSLIDLRKQGKQNKRLLDESKITEQKRLLGLVILRGEGIISVVVEAAPNITGKPQLKLKKGKGTAKHIKTLNDEKKTIGGGVHKMGRQ